MSCVAVTLHGNLSTFQPSTKLFVGSIRELFSALFSQIRDFREFLIDRANEGAFYQIVVNGRRWVGEENLEDPLGNCQVDIIPCIEGSGKNGGIFKIIAGVILVAIGIFTGFAPAILLGISLALQGIVSILSPSPKNDVSDKEVEQKKSFVFNGASNSSPTGSRVPVILGAGYCRGTGYNKGLIVGSITISGFIRSYYTEDEDQED